MDTPKLQMPTLKTLSSSTSMPMVQTVLREGYIPRNERKKILLLSDDLRMPSGVGVMSKQIVMGTAHRYNWVQIGAGINHPDAGKVLDASTSFSQELGFDAYLKMFPYNGYGDQNIVRTVLAMERPDAILHFTDPRYWEWLYHMEAEVREFVPIFFYHVWDDLPYPKYNENFYRSCDYIACISRQTYNIVKNVWKKDPPKDWQVQYIPHGIDPEVFYKVESEEDKQRAADVRKRMFGEDADKVKFIVFFNNRNIRRKMPGDVVLAYRDFLRGLPEEERDSCRLLFHTSPVDMNGTDIPKVLADIAPDVKYLFSTSRINPSELNLIYNNVDVVINLASNEGFGLSTLEGLMTERMIVANVTGGLQDQMGFKDEEGNYVNEEDHFCEEWGSNHDGKYRDHGEWVVPVYPSNRALVGSPPTPYIFDDRCKWEDAAVALRTIYDMPKEERERRGKLAREYCLSEGFHADAMCDRFIEGMDNAFEKWESKDRFVLVEV